MAAMKHDDLHRTDSEWSDRSAVTYLQSARSLEKESIGEQELGLGDRQAVPDGGLTAWLQVLGSFLLSFNSWGIIYSFGVFQTYYQEELLKNESPSTISWLGSIQSFVLGVVGFLGGPLYDAGHLSGLMGAGSVFLILGLALTSICRRWWQLLITQAFCVGIGTGCLYVPSVVVPVEYFERKRALAMGIAQSGGALGGIVYPVVFQQLLKTIGFGWATRALALIALVTCVISGVVMHVRVPGKKRAGFGYIFARIRDSFDLPALKEPSFALFVVASVTSDLGLFVPITYIEPYAVNVAKFPATMTSVLLPLLNAMSIPGHILPGALAMRTGPFNLLVPTAILAGVLALAWIAVGHNVAGLFAFAILYGFMYGAYVTLPELAISTITKDLGRLGARVGMCGLANSLGSLLGTPIAGALLNMDKSYFGLQLFVGLVLVTTGLLVLIVRFLRVGWNFGVKV